MARKSVILGSIALLHAAVGIGVYAAGVWDIRQLDGTIAPSKVVAAIMPEPEAGGGPIKLPEQTVVQKEKPVTTDLTQQQEKKPDAPAKPTVATSPDIGQGSGEGPGSGSGSATSKGKCLVDCGEDKDAKPPVIEKKPADEVKMINPNDLTLMRTGGSTQIHPNDVIKTQMLRDGNQRNVGVVKVCVSETGQISSVSMLAPTKYPAYDAILLAGVRTWTYRPYAAAGRTLKVCGTVTFVYSIK